MSVVGIIAEYNPFHNGHSYQIAEAKRLTGADYAVVLMSGNYVQRGTPAIADKYTRTQMALASGADLVLELPSYYATASAEAFAFGSVSILNALSFVDFLSFGCETPDTSTLMQLAELFINEPKEYKEKLLHYQKSGFSFPSAREQATIDYLSSISNEEGISFTPETSTSDSGFSLSQIQELLANPNNILALEYCKALLKLQSNIQICPISRTGSAYHETDLSSNFASASALRTNYFKRQELAPLSSYIPAKSLTFLQDAEQKTFPISENDFSGLFYYKTLQHQDFSTFLDVTPDFSNKLKKAASYGKSFSDLANELKSKDIVYTRICRNLLHILLNIYQEDINVSPSYVRLLGFKKAASHLLKAPAAIPIITKVADAKKQLSPEAYSRFEREIDMSHLYYHVCHEKFHILPKTEYQRSPIVLP